MRPGLPPGTLVLSGARAPLFGGGNGAGVAVLVDPVLALALAWGVDHACYVARVGKGKAGVGVGDLAYLPRRVPRHDVVLLRPDGVDLAPYGAEVYLAPLHLHRAGLDEVVLEVGVPEVEGVGVAGHARAVG